MATITFTGTVSAEVAVGETVTETYTRPDKTVGTATGLSVLNADAKTIEFTITAIETLAGDYTFAASIGADAQYAAATQTPDGTFTIPLAARTITSTAVVA